MPLGVELGAAAGHRLVLLSLELWPDWADLRFARLEAGGPPLARRVPAAPAWRVEADGRPLEVVEVVGRGDRAFSNGEARLVPAPHGAAELAVHGEAPELPAALREAAPLPEPEDATAADWTQALLTPVRSGLVIARADLARAAHELGLGSRVGERAFALRALLDQDARAVLDWIAGEATRQSDDLHAVSATAGEGVAAWWRGRLERTADVIARQLAGR